ncbi:MAG: bifunctional methylenetetrahydrofolate dehydrogenase/methenyltetrahydrofolate cyclohydrolase FolD [Acidimicrobiia bacterium]|nr:bifunctional methylenetetrahydrofolate dehydrogenase/methenyltetrahydrofolate cyclohydrolase FolD [Acidimicrobiia bacterium]MDH4309045.1 bifunctional methylenetetrahydrofolate dehydrogenase/methenyltetrahydrofolate cyclohydrolase FolD [Acidimicrobiia bacterium]MDH5293620.1 bifunctional methylenetetrahydrofolate dehydrogenase/methenyltetrahydrofolate cyclohydrolase FolD [Acidimicrobiia bacterium]
MTAKVLSGAEVAESVLGEVEERVRALAARGKSVGLATVLVGEDPASHVYVRNKRRTAERVGITSIHHELGADASQEEVESLIRSLNDDPDVDGILLQLPLPGDLDGQRAVEAISPAKDADGLHPMNLGHLVLDTPVLAPCTPSGSIRILDHYGIPTSGANVVVVGRSFLVGRPLAILLGSKDRNATVTLAHSRTRDLPALCATADILVAAIGRPEMITADYVKPGATVIDVGINRTEAGLVGDVAFDDVVSKAGAITPVPGGVGKMTIAMLMANTVSAAERRLG